MKKLRTISKATLSLLLCCAMLSCVAFAAGPVEVYHVGDVTITFGGEAPTIMPQANQKVLLGGDFIFSSTRKFYPIRTDPNDGSNLSLRVDNFGSTNIRVTYTIKVGNEPEVEVMKEIPPIAYVYGSATSEAGGLNCTVTIEVEPVNAGETGHAYISVLQY